MDIHRAIQDLLEERLRLDEAIARLEEIARQREDAPDEVPGRRGRRGMSDEERKAVSQRMRKYWAVRRKQSKDS